MRSKRQSKGKCVCAWNDFDNSLLVSKKKNTQAWVHYKRGIISVMTQQQKQNHVTVRMKTPENILLCKCQSHCGSTSLQPMRDFETFRRGAHGLHWRHSEADWWMWFHTPQQEAQTPSVHCNVLAEVESHLSVIMEPCRHRWLLTLTNNLHSFSNRTGIMFRSEWAGNYWRRTAQMGEMGMAETEKKDVGKNKKKKSMALHRSSRSPSWPAESKKKKIITTTKKNVCVLMWAAGGTARGHLMMIESYCW